MTGVTGVDLLDAAVPFGEQLRLMLEGTDRTERDKIFRFFGSLPVRGAGRQAAPETGFVYFIRQGASGPIKIGWAFNVATRVKALQAGSPERLQVLARVRGQRTDEAAAHALFAELRLYGEWFRPAPALLRYIEDLGPAS